MANQKRARQSLEISDLPRNVIDSILERLPVIDAVQMSSVSKKFRHFWLTLPHIIFDAQFWEDVFQDGNEVNHLMFRDIVSGILLNHIGPVTKFNLCIPDYDYVTGRPPCISQFISFLSVNGIKDLTIDNRHECIEVPSALFSCLDLVKLNLGYVRFDPPPSFRGFQKLECLVLEDISFKGDRFGGFISNCPRLELLSLVGWMGLESITINAPKLKSLSISGASFTSIALSNVANLVSVSITFHKFMHIYYEGGTQQMIKTLASSCKLEKLHFGTRILQFLGARGISEILPITFHYLRDLELSNVNLNDHDEASCAVGIIKSCPNMVKLDISVATNRASVEHDLDYYSHDLVLNHLCNANIRCIRGLSSELKLIEYIFASSPILEEFSVMHDIGLEATAIIAMSKELMRLSRASTKAKLIFKDPKGGDRCTLVILLVFLFWQDFSSFVVIGQGGGGYLTTHSC